MGISGAPLRKSCPFSIVTGHTDATVGVVAHVFDEGALPTIEAFRAELAAVSFDEKRLVL